jgi:hypothetical protein
MTAAQIVLLVIGIIAANVLVQGTVWILIIRGWRRKAARLAADLEREMALSGERFLRAPARVRYAGVTGGRAMALAALTGKRLVVMPFRGPVITFTRDGAIASVRSERWYRSSAQARRMNVVLQLRHGEEFAFSVPDADAPGWVNDVQRALAAG